MTDPIETPINAIRQRLRVQQLLNCAAWGLFLAAFVILAFPILAGVIVLISIFAGLIRPPAPLYAARLIDQHYHLKDRILTSAVLLRQPSRTPMQQLQIEDAVKHLQAVCPKSVLPIRQPKMLWIALAVLALNMSGSAIVRSQFHQSVDGIETALQTLPAEHIAILEEVLAETEELAQRHADERILQELTGRMDTLLGQLDVTNQDIRESLAVLSEMDTALQSAIGSMNLETMDTTLKELAKALEISAMMIPISRALERGEYASAASELQNWDAEMLKSLSSPERRAMSEQMQAVADNAEGRHQPQLQDAAQKMSDALETGNGELARSAAALLAGEVEKHRVRREIGKALASQQMMLAMMKANDGEGNMSGGKGTEKSDTARETWGAGSAGDPNTGLETQLQSQRQQEMLTGILGGDGTSETETVDSQDTAPAQSVVQYRERFLEYQKTAEAVLETEPIPAGQRQVIRRYFESIRPE